MIYDVMAWWLDTNFSCTLVFIKFQETQPNSQNAMSGGAAPLFKQSAKGLWVLGFWAPPVAGNLQSHSARYYADFNSIERQRQVGLLKNGLLASTNNSKFHKQIQNYFGCWQYRYDNIQELRCIQPVEESTDAIKSQFLAKWDDKIEPFAGQFY